VRRNSKVNPVHLAYRMASALFSSFRQAGHVVGNRRQLLLRRRDITTAGRMGETAATDNFHDRIVGGLTLVPGNRLRSFDVGGGTLAIGAMTGDTTKVIVKLPQSTGFTCSPTGRNSLMPAPVAAGSRRG
jgi:hypothetical protein